VAYKRDSFLDPGGSPTAFSLDLAAKDLRLIIAAAEAVGLPMVQATTNLGLILDAAGSVGPERDFALVAEHLRGLVATPGGGGSRT
jgi:3-hydroxyisobutyrate dehydrogenase-like beta-hydroxyacid dehydrogenase